MDELIIKHVHPYVGFFSNCSVINVVVPVLDAVPVKVVVVVVSWKVVVVLKSSCQRDAVPSPPFTQPPVVHVLLELDVSVHELVLELVLDPVHTVSHEFQTVGANPV